MNEYIKIENQLPRNNQHIFIFYNSEEGVKRVKGFYYKNGTNPTFAAYGSEIKNVIGWLPR